MKIGIDLGGTNVRVALVDDNGIVKVVKEPSKADKSVEETMDHIKGLIREVITTEVKGIGIGVPSAIDPVKGIVYNVINIPSWKEVHIKDILEKEFHLPVYVNNDANCFVLGEKYYGLGKPFRNLLGVTLGTGVGSGVIIGGELYMGTHTCAGEIGCLPYLDHTYEHYCSSGFFKKWHGTSGLEAYQAARDGNEGALAVWREFGEHVGALVSMILYTYDPQAIILGGSIANAYDLFAPAMFEKLKGFLFPNIVEDLVIDISRINDIGILGAASLVRN